MSTSRGPAPTSRTTARATGRRADAGDTLIEVLVALAVVAVAGLSILLAFTTQIIGSSGYRTVATTDTVLRSAAEQATSLIQGQPSSAWETCSDAQLTPSQFSLPSGYSATVSSVQYWNSATQAFQASCIGGAAQLVQITVDHDGSSYSISVVLDDPQQQVLDEAGPATQLVFIQQPTADIAGSSISPPPVVAVEDVNGNIVTTDLSPALLAIKSGTGTAGATISPTCSGAEFYGVVTFSNCAISTQGSGYKLIATDGTLAPAVSQPFNVLPPPASQLQFTTAATGTQAASTTAASGPYVITEQDYTGAAVAAPSPVTVTLGTTSTGTPVGGAPFFSLTKDGTSSNAVTTLTIPAGASSTPPFYYADTQAGSPTLSGTNPQLLAATTSITVPLGATSRVGFTTPPPVNVTPGATFPVVVAEEDVYGNPEGAGTALLSLSASGGGFSCQTSPTRFAGGVATYSNCAYATASTSPYTLTAASAGLTPATATTTVGAGPPAKVVFTTPPPASVGAGVPFAVTVAEEDAFGNVELADSSSPVTLSSSGLGFICSTAPASFTDGVAAFSGCSIPTPSATPYTLTAASGTLTPAVATTTVLGPPSALAYTVAPPTTTTAGTTFTVTVAEEDANGNVEAADSSTALAIAASSGSGFSCATSPAHLTAGLATFTGCAYTVAGTGDVLTATSGSLTPASAPTTVVAAPAAMVVYTTPPPSSTTAGTAFSVAVALEDRYGNLETQDSSTAVALSANDGGGGFGCTSAPTQVTNGVAAFSGCSFTIASATPYTLSANATGVTGATATTSVAPGTPVRLVWTTTPPATVRSTTTFSAAVAEQDAEGNVETQDSTSSVALTASNGSSSGGFACTSAPAHLTAGTATFAGCSFATPSATAYTVSATAGGLPAATAPVTVYGPPAQLAFTTAPPSSVSAGATFGVVVAEEDANGTLESGDSTTALSLQATAGYGFSCTTTPTHVTGGIATYSGCRFTKASASGVTVTASSGTLTPATASVTVLPGAATQLVYTTAPPATATAGSGFGVGVAEEDAYGNVETPDSTTAIALAANNGGGGFSCSVAPAQFTNGVAAFAGCAYTKAASYVLSATSGSLSPATASTTVGPSGAAELAYTTAPPASAAAGSTFGVVVAEEDTYGNVETADSSTTLTLASNVGSGFMCTTTPTRVTHGVATYAGCSFTKAGSTYAVTASSGVLLAATATTTVTPGTATQLVFSTPPPATATAGTSFPVTVTEEDAFGNVETGDSTTALTLSANDGGGGFSCATSPSRVTSGVASYLGCAFLHPGAFTLSATATGETPASAAVSVTRGALDQVAFATAPQTFESGTAAATSGSGTITVQLQDAEGNPVPAPAGGVSVSLSSTSSTGAFTPASPLTIAAGTSSASFTYDDTTPGTPTLKATVASLPVPSATQVATVLGTASTHVTVSAANETVNAGSTATFAVSVANTTASASDFSVTAVGGLPAGASWSVPTDACQTIRNNGHSGGSATYDVAVPTSTSTPNGAPTLAFVVTQWSSTTGACSGSVLATAEGQATLTVHASATQLVFATQPTSGTHGATITPSVTVLLDDADYDLVATSGTQVQVALGNDPGGATLSGTTTVATAGGTATFSTLKVSAAGTGYTLVATSAGLASATSSAFNES